MRTTITLAAIAAASAVFTANTMLAEVPAGYYESLDGKTGEDLSKAISALADGHTVITYNTKTWGAFETTDVRQFGDRQIWWDMYSNNIVYTEEHAALNIEHCVANSWWGGKTQKEPYADLFHLTPSDQNANNKKGSYPPGDVIDARLLDNGVFKIGTAAEGQGNGASSVFEPADEYKGDFARAYFYIFATYQSIPWIQEGETNFGYVYGEGGKLLPWAVDVLLRWHRLDPVDSKEINRNEEVYKLQGNRNAFIDYPQLVEYLWGDKTAEAFALENESVATATDRPEAPVFDGARVVGVNTYSHRWWDGYNQTISHDKDAVLMLSINGGSYQESEGDTYLDPALDGDYVQKYSAYVKKTVDGKELTSPIAWFTATGLDPDETNYSFARWERVTADDPTVDEDGKYLLLSTNTLHTMGTDGGVSTAFMPSAGFVWFDGELVTELPVDAAIVTFQNVGDDQYRLMVNDVRGQYKGSWNAYDKNKMKLDEEYTPGTVAINDNDEFVFTFTQFGTLQFNKSQPRFLNYSSNQGSVYLYRLKDMGQESGIQTLPQETPWGVGVDGNDIIVDENTRVFDLNGRPVDGRSLGKGVYIVVGNGRSHKVVI